MWFPKMWRFPTCGIQRATTKRTILPLLVAVTGELWYCEQSFHNICCGKWIGKALGQFLSKTHSLFGAGITKTSFTIGFATVMDFGTILLKNDWKKSEVTDFVSLFGQQIGFLSFFKCQKWVLWSILHRSRWCLFFSESQNSKRSAVVDTHRVSTTLAVPN